MKRFKVIEGGTRAEPEQWLDWRKKFAELREINMTLRARWYSRRGPRANFSVLLGLVVGGVVMAGFWALGKAGVKVEGWAFSGVPLAVLVLVYQLGLRYSKRPLTYTAMLDDQLAKYEPVNREAYRQLQWRVREFRYLETEFVMDWLGQERHAVELSAGIRKLGADSFLDKKI